MTAFYDGLLFLGRKCLHATSQKRALSHAISLAVNYRLFSHGDVSYRFNGENDNVVLESNITSTDLDVCFYATSPDYVFHAGKCLYRQMKTVAR